MICRRLRQHKQKEKAKMITPLKFKNRGKEMYNLALKPVKDDKEEQAKREITRALKRIRKDLQKEALRGNKEAAWVLEHL